MRGGSDAGGYTMKEEEHLAKMDPTMVLAQQRMHVGESTHEVDRSGRAARKETSATTSSLTDWRSAPTFKGEGKRPRINQTTFGTIFERIAKMDPTMVLHSREHVGSPPMKWKGADVSLEKKRADNFSLTWSSCTNIKEKEKDQISMHFGRMLVNSTGPANFCGCWTGVHHVIVVGLARVTYEVLVLSAIPITMEARWCSKPMCIRRGISESSHRPSRRSYECFVVWKQHRLAFARLVMKPIIRVRKDELVVALMSSCVERRLHCLGSASRGAEGQ